MEYLGLRLKDLVDRGHDGMPSTGVLYAIR